MSRPSTLNDEKFTKALKKIYKTKEGQTVIKKILNACKIRDHGFVPGDSLATAFHCGQKSIGLWLLAELENENTDKRAD